MEQNDLMNALEFVGEDLVAEAKKPKKKMKKNIVKAVAGLVAASVAVSFFWGGNTTINANYSSKYNKVFGEFTAKSTVELLADKKENTCYSPVSLFAAMALTAEATNGDTRQEILDAFGVNSLDELEEMYRTMAVDLDVDYNPKPVDNGYMMMTPVKTPAKITLCNSLWINDSMLGENSDEVIKRCMKNMKCEIFADGPVDPVKVNSWVSENTNGRIDNIMDEDYSPAIALVNTLYYKASWTESYGHEDDKFYPEKGDEVTTKFICSTEESLRYKECGEFTVLEVPLQEGSMLLVLPRKGKKLEKIMREDVINAVISMSTNDQMDRGYVNWSLPEYEIEDEYSEKMISSLNNMGIETLFGNNTWEISSGLNNSFVDICQRTYINVNKKGVEAAAATAVSAVYIGIEDEKKIALEIKFDRPFMYVLIKNGVPMFIGTVYNPVE